MFVYYLLFNRSIIILTILIHKMKKWETHYRLTILYVVMGLGVSTVVELV